MVSTLTNWKIELWMVFRYLAHKKTNLFDCLMTFFIKVNRNRGCGEGIQEVSAANELEKGVYPKVRDLCRCSPTPIFSSICKNLRLFSWYSVSRMYPIWRNVSYPLPTDFFCMLILMLLLFLQLTPWNNYVKINIWGETSVINWKDSEVSSKSRYYWVGNPSVKLWREISWHW